MKVPAGDQTGRKSNARSSVMALSCLVSRSTTRTSYLVRCTFWKTIFFPSGDQRGARCQISSLLSVVACCGLCPWLSRSQMRRGPAQEASTAMRAPSGEKDGLKALSASRSSLPGKRDAA